jgi:hypothetical protein
VRGPIPDGEIVPSASQEGTTVRRITSADVRRVTVTIRVNDNPHRAPSAVVTKSTRSKRRSTCKEFLPVPTLFRRRQIWLPTWQGALLLVASSRDGILIALRHLARAISPQRPVAARDGAARAR